MVTDLASVRQFDARDLTFGIIVEFEASLPITHGDHTLARVVRKRPLACQFQTFARCAGLAVNMGGDQVIAPIESIELRPGALYFRQSPDVIISEGPTARRIFALLNGNEFIAFVSNVLF